MSCYTGTEARKTGKETLRVGLVNPASGMLSVPLWLLGKVEGAFLIFEVGGVVRTVWPL